MSRETPTAGPGPQLAWLGAAAALGFAVPAVFSGLAGMARDAYLLVWVPAAGALTGTYLARAAPPAWRDPARAPARAAAVGLLVGALLVLSVGRQPAGARAGGPSLVLDLAWAGVAYGVVDALLLTVLPVAATCGALAARRRAAGEEGAGAAWSGGVAAGLALAASLAVTAVYHLGYEEFRGLSLVGPLVGNGAVTVAYLVSRNPVAPVLAHVAMHVAAVLHGMEAAVQLPPHG